MIRSGLRGAFSIASVTLICAFGANSDAQPKPSKPAAGTTSPENRAAAMALFDQGRKLMQDGKYAEACPKLAESYRLDPGTGTLYNLSDCYEHIGRTATAWTGFRDVAAASKAAKRSAREQDARDRVAALEPRLTKLKIRVTEIADDLKVTRNGDTIGSEMWGIALPVDPDSYTITASQPGKKKWEKTIVAKGEGFTAAVVIPVLEPATGTPPVIPPPEPITPLPEPDPEPPDRTNESPRSWQTPLGISLQGLGAAALGAGIIVGVLAKSKADDADCDEEGICSPDGLDQRDAAVTQGNVATGLFIGGAVFAAAGLVVWLTAPSSDDEQQDDTAQLAFKLMPTGFALSGRF